MHQSKAPGFNTTNWSLVLASMDTAPGRATEAMERLCGRYWYPVYATIRRYGHDAHHAEDLTQEFFAFAIKCRLLQQARSEKGRFRGFILTALRNFLHNQHERTTAIKRGGRHHFLPLEEASAESILANEPRNSSSLDAFDRRWATTLIRRVLENLRNEFVRRDRGDVHDALLHYLTAEPAEGDYERTAASLAMEPGTVRVAVHRLRHRFGELLRSEVAHTVTDPEDVQEEIRYLLSVLSDC